MCALIQKDPTFPLKKRLFLTENDTSEERFSIANFLLFVTMGVRLNEPFYAIFENQLIHLRVWTVSAKATLTEH